MWQAGAAAVAAEPLAVRPELQRWHPVHDSRRLRKKPVAVRLHGEELVLFRDGSGAVGVLEDRCPHRGMRLSEGCVDGGRLVCPCHAWSYDTDGDGHWPASPDMTFAARAFDHVAKWTLSELDGMDPEHERFKAKVTVLIESVRHHVEEEEGELFPKVREALGRKALGEIGEAGARPEGGAHAPAPASARRAAGQHPRRHRRRRVRPSPQGRHGGGREGPAGGPVAAPLTGS